MAEKIIEFNNVSFAYSGANVLDKVSFEIERGDFVGIIGPNGAGKTTLAKLMLGIIKPDKGTIRLFGEDIKKFREWHKIGYIPQKATNFDPNFPASVFEVASMGRIPKAGLLKAFSQKDKKAIENALEMVGIFGLKDRKIGELSGGQQQRAFIARALAAEAELLILDEPTVGVDQEAQHEFYQLLNRLNKNMKITLVLISHDIGIVTKNANKVGCVNVSLTMHKIDGGKGIENVMACAYNPDFWRVPHHHH